MIGDSFHMRQVMLERLKMALQRQMSVEMASCVPTVTLDHIADRLVMDLRRQLLAHRMPDEHYRHVAMEPRHASPWDMFKARNRGRWWWPKALSHVSYVDVPVVVHIDIRSYWTFPQSEIPPSEMLGRPVMWTDTVVSS